LLLIITLPPLFSPRFRRAPRAAFYRMPPYCAAAVAAAERCRRQTPRFRHAVDAAPPGAQMPPPSASAVYTPPAVELPPRRYFHYRYYVFAADFIADADVIFTRSMMILFLRFC
jgi:hypothetical protein